MDDLTPSHSDGNQGQGGGAWKWIAGLACCGCLALGAVPFGLMGVGGFVAYEAIAELNQSCELQLEQLRADPAGGYYSMAPGFQAAVSEEQAVAACQRSPFDEVMAADSISYSATQFQINNNKGNTSGLLDVDGKQIAVVFQVENSGNGWVVRDVLLAGSSLEALAREAGIREALPPGELETSEPELESSQDE